MRTTIAQESPAFHRKPVDAWIESLADTDVRVRWYAAYALGQIGPDSAQATEPLAQMAANRGEYEYIRSCAAWAIGRIGPEADAAVAPLLTVLDQSGLLCVRREAVWALGEIGSAAEPAVPKLESRLKDPDPTTRVRAAASLWKIARHDRALPTLIEALSNDDPLGSFEAANLLGRLGQDAEPAVEALVEALSSENSDVARAATRALGQFDLSTASLQPALKSTDGTTRRRAVEALGGIGIESIDLLIEATKDTAASVRRSAARSLGRLGPEAIQAESALIEAVSDPDRQVRQTAADALRRIRK